jgi:RNA polymerase sigma-70 factor (ECF subfamily)
MADTLKLEMVALLPRLRGFARTLTGSTHDADDLVQQTCERVLSTEAGPAEGARVDAWMFRIMRNLFIDGYRRKRPKVVLDDALAETLPGQDGRVVSEARLDLQAVQAVVGALPEDQRSVLVLVCVEGLRYREVAEIMDIPIGTVMSRLARARAAISAALEGPIELATNAGKSG